jgi:hypothetical protein
MRAFPNFLSDDLVHMQFDSDRYLDAFGRRMKLDESTHNNFSDQHSVSYKEVPSFGPVVQDESTSQTTGKLPTQPT